MKTSIKIVGIVAIFAIAISIILFVYPYAKSYTVIETYDKREKLPLEGEPEIYASTGDWIDDYKRMVANNFVLLGTSDYNTGRIRSKAALALATVIGAQIVIIKPIYANTDTEVIPFLARSENRSDNSDHMSEASQKNANDTDADMAETSFVPDAISAFDYGAQFWARARLPVFGANFSNFDTGDARIAGTEDGVKIYVIIRNSPAYEGNVNINDLITHVDDNPVRGVEDFMDIIERNAGSEIILSVIRKKRKLILPIKLNDTQ